MRAPVALLILLLSGCARLEGVWMFRVTVAPDTGEECLTDVQHNLAQAAVPLSEEEAGGWTAEESAAQSDRVSFGRFAEMGESDLLVLDGDVLVEITGSDAEQRTFQWEQSESADEARNHESGYAWEQTSTADAVVRVVVSQDGDALSGTWEKETASVVTSNESDTWEEEAAVGESGVLPSGTYLERPNDDGSGTETATNDRTTADCSDDPCLLTVSTSCLWVYALAASRTDIEPEDPSWPEAGWQEGVE